jgi:multidrug resistance efflux pump
MRASAVVVLAFCMLAGAGCSDKPTGPITWQVKRGQFVEEVRANGQLVSIGCIDICCDVKPPDSRGTSILWLVPEGTAVEPAPDWEPDQDRSIVEPPDLLVKLDSSRFEDQLVEQRIVCNDSQATVSEAQGRYEAATAALKGFKELAVEAQRKTLEAEIATLRVDLFDAENKLERGKQSFAIGALSRNELDVLQFEFEAIERQMEVPQGALKDLGRHASSSVSQLKFDLDAAKAKLDSQERNHRLNLQRLADIETRIEACTIRAPAAGQVLYATVVDRQSGLETTIQEGMFTHAGRALLRLWNREQVKLKAGIGEAWVSAIGKGMLSTVRLDTFSDKEISGVVDDVSVYPVARPASGTAEYETTIRLTGDTPLALRPGLTGEARITVQSLPSVLTVPKDTVLRRNDRIYCILYRDRTWEARQVQIGANDGTICVVLSGLKEGEEVVRNAEQSGNKVTWPLWEGHYSIFHMTLTWV